MASEHESAAVLAGNPTAASSTPHVALGLAKVLALVAAVALLPFAIPVNIATEIVI